MTDSTDWHVSFSPAKRPGYSGVAIFSRVAPTKIETRLGEERFDDEGRFIVAHFGRLAVASIYFPNGKGKDRDNSRVGYKLDFYRTVFDRLNELRRRGKVYVLGDSTLLTMRSTWRVQKAIAKPVVSCQSNARC